MTTFNTLYELSDAFHNVEEMLTNPELTFSDEETDALSQAFAEIELDFNEKVENTVKFCKNLDLQADLIDEEIKRLTARKKGLQNRSAWLKAGIKGAMIANGISKVPSALFTISLSKPRAGAVVIDIPVEQLPDEYKVVKVEPNKQLLKEDLKNGLVIDGVSLEETQTLTIR